MLELDRLTRRFGGADGVTAVDEVSFEVAEGRMTGFVGGNGAGKTTTMRMIMGVLAPTSGTVHWRGHEVTTSGDLSPTLHASIDRALAQILREALHNVAKHGLKHGPCTIVGELSAVDYQLIVTNQMPPDQTNRTGLGTLGMRHRATLAGGSLRLASANGTWTCLVEMPLTVRQLQT